MDMKGNDKRMPFFGLSWKNEHVLIRLREIKIG